MLYQLYKKEKRCHKTNYYNVNAELSLLRFSYDGKKPNTEDLGIKSKRYSL